MSQCPCAYFDGIASACCVLDEGHDGRHEDVLGEWNVQEPLDRRRTRLIRAARRMKLDLQELIELYEHRSESFDPPGALYFSDVARDLSALLKQSEEP